MCSVFCSEELRGAPLFFATVRCYYSGMKKAAAVAVLCLLSLLALPAMSMRISEETHPFDSIPMLETYYDESDDGNSSFWAGCEVSLLTISDGGPLYSWFGHAAILVTTPEGRSLTFDYGTFSFNDEDFFVNFAFGRLWFVCVCSNAERQIEEAEAEGRTVTKVVLPLSTEQKKAVIGFLNTNSRYENRVYLYHHYNDNCATRLRDIIDRTTDGAFKAWAQGISGYTFRQQASRALSRNPLVLWGLDFLQSGQIDRSATLWDEMFLPEMLEKGVMTFFGLENEVITTDSGNRSKTAQKPQNNVLFAALLGIGLGGISALLMILGCRRANYIYSGILEIVFGILGSVLLFMMVFTNHDVTWFNENIIFVNPGLIAVAVFSFLASSRKKTAEEWGRLSCACQFLLLALIILLCLLKLAAHRVFIQANWNIIITMALFYLPNAFRLILTRRDQSERA